MNRNDTIVAISTAAGVGGIAVVRLSGSDALALAYRHLTIKNLTPRHATYCGFYASTPPHSSPEEANVGEFLDDIVAIYYPRGYSGEPTVEFACHGSAYIQQALLQSLADSGARLAEPGEFTMRAYLNGRLDLSQAEAVADLIDAVTPQQHRLAVSQLRGGYAQKLKELRQQMVDLTSLLELELDFSQEDVEFADRTRLRQLLTTLDIQLSALISSFSMGNALKRGVPVAIVGAPNAGTSTLLNALLQDDRAMVSNVPGTTRDTVEETLTVDDITFRFIDTAGLHSTDDPLESMGIERSYRAIQQAKIILLLHEASVPIKQFTAIEEISKCCNVDEKSIFLVHTKCDLCQPDVDGGIRVIAKHGFGIDDLKRRLVDHVHKNLPKADDVLLSNVRHKDALQHVKDALQHVSDGLDQHIPIDLVAVDLRDALYHLGTVTGEVTSDDVLGNIFSRFCIGK